MPKPLPLNHSTMATWKGRLASLRPDAKPRFGALPPAGMVRHLRRTLEPVTGDFDPGVDLSNFFTRSSFFRWLFLAMPWPKGKVKAPDWLTPAAEGSLEEERELLFRTMERFAAMLQADPSAQTKNPLLGPVSLEYVSRLQGKHFEHHCEQFGL